MSLLGAKPLQLNYLTNKKTAALGLPFCLATDYQVFLLLAAMIFATLSA